ncbi:MULTISPECIES: hypothetical protein [Sinorhizobium]|uniref:hypothetical protein n=1 Tax=Sinorhizobium TaxID=28105 RepID=UPI0024B255C4|nr:hypothetical protein [Sinorhizobium terangae]WFU51910.1 hypothetical protein QA637_28780 [Sinorhizobium terangae]
MREGYEVSPEINGALLITVPQLTMCDPYTLEQVRRERQRHRSMLPQDTAFWRSRPPVTAKAIVMLQLLEQLYF